MMIDRLLSQLVFAVSLCAPAGHLVAADPVQTEQGRGRYMEMDEFLQAAFPDVEPKPAVLWIDDALREQIEDLLGHEFGVLRVRYWEHSDKTAWVFDEIGREQPITIGVAVEGGAVEIVRVLEFREPRGWEIRHAFFMDQFSGARAKSGGKLDRSIDGVTGATLSVAAVTRVVRLALFMSQRTQQRRS